MEASEAVHARQWAVLSGEERWVQDASLPHPCLWHKLRAAEHAAHVTRCPAATRGARGGPTQGAHVSATLQARGGRQPQSVKTPLCRGTLCCSSC